MPRDAFVLKIQRELCLPKCARKVSGLSRNRPQFPVGLMAQTVERCTSITVVRVRVLFRPGLNISGLSFAMLKKHSKTVKIINIKIFQTGSTVQNSLTKLQNLMHLYEELLSMLQSAIGIRVRVRVHNTKARSKLVTTYITFCSGTINFT